MTYDQWKTTDTSQEGRVCDCGSGEWAYRIYGCASAKWVCEACEEAACIESDLMDLDERCGDNQ